MTDNDSEIKFRDFPKQSGSYRLDNGHIAFGLTTKPSRWHRFWTWVFLGWVYHEEGGKT